MPELFFDLRATHNPHRWYLPITDDVAVGREPHTFMFGGIGLAAGVQALERTCERPVIWATAQYLAYARPPSVLDIDVWTPAEGKTVTQARAIGHVGDKEIITVNAALGVRPGAPVDQWQQAPAAPAPADCPPVERDAREHKGLMDRIEVRVAAGRAPTDRQLEGRSEDGRMMLWIRLRETWPVDAGMLALFGDYLPSCVSHAMGRHVWVNSLDNTIRFGPIVETEWVLCDVRVTMMHGGFVHGAMHMFSQDGVLMATGSQSMVLRAPPP